MARRKFWLGTKGPFFYDPDKTRPDGTAQAAFSVEGSGPTTDGLDVIDTGLSASTQQLGWWETKLGGTTGYVWIGASTQANIGGGGALGAAFATTIGNSSDKVFEIQHGLGTKAIGAFSLWDTAPTEDLLISANTVTLLSNNTLQVNLSTAPSTGQYRAVVLADGGGGGGGGGGISSPLTTKGDLFAFDGSNNTRLPAGSDGDALVARSAATTGLRYEPVSGGGGSLPEYDIENQSYTDLGLGIDLATTSLDPS